MFPNPKGIELGTTGMLSVCLTFCLCQYITPVNYVILIIVRGYLKVIYGDGTFLM